MARLAVVLLNLGGPDSLDAVRPFLINLFSDPAIIAAPRPLRWLLARWIARRREMAAREIYGHLGGSSPLRANTEIQAAALAVALDDEARVFVAMRYWHPRSDHVVQAVRDWDPDRIVLLPLYPQFSTTTTGSSLDDWARAAAANGLERPTSAVCCYPTQPGFVAALADAIAPALRATSSRRRPRLLLTAHGLPETIDARGDPYRRQVVETARAVVARLAESSLDWLVCYQSRVGPLAWIGPATDDEIRRAGREGTPLVVAPISFVSEHSETLVELDRDYRALAERSGVPSYVRVPTVADSTAFIAGLAQMVREAAERRTGLDAGDDGWRCGVAAETRLCPRARRATGGNTA